MIFSSSAWKLSSSRNMILAIKYKDEDPRRLSASSSILLICIAIAQKMLYVLNRRGNVDKCIFIKVFHWKACNSFVYFNLTWGCVKWKSLFVFSSQMITGYSGKAWLPCLRKLMILTLWAWLPAETRLLIKLSNLTLMWP